ncbi:MAG: hypothetical protein QOD55_2701 [Solirubrobacteraceae bacterium]|nr:hypothetical protein [Solirubrobacteraceae bacterium]
MALDRQSVARRDFPMARRGYEPAAVDAHLAALADEVEELRGRAAPGVALATQAGEQVRAILEAAERSAEGIREDAAADARAHVAAVAEAAARLRQRIDALEGELTGVFAELRTGAERLAAGLEDVAATAAALAPGGSAPEIARSALGATLGETAGAVDEEEVGEEPALAAVTEAPGSQATGAPAEADGDGDAAAAIPARSADAVGARLVALEMAISGRPRDDIDRFLAERYELPDRAALLEDVYARVQG